MELSPNVDTYAIMTIQDLCSALNQDNPVEIKAILEIMLSRIINDIYSGEGKKNVTYVFLHQMALPVYYINQGWKDTYGEYTNQILLRAFAILACIVWEFRNRESKHKNLSDGDFIQRCSKDIMNKLFNSVIEDAYTLDSSNEEMNGAKSTAINSLSFNISPYVKLLPKLDVIPIIISCMRQNDIRIVTMSVNVLKLLCQWNGSFIKTITDYTFSSAVYVLLLRIRFNIFNDVEINYEPKKKGGFFQSLRSNINRSLSEEEIEGRKQHSFLLDVEDSFFVSISSSNDEDSISSIFSCSEEDGQESLLQSLLSLIVYMDSNKKSDDANQFIVELHESNCEELLIQFLFYFISKKNEILTGSILSVLLVLFKYFKDYHLFINLTEEQQISLLSCEQFSKLFIYEQALTIILISIIRSKDTDWFSNDTFTDSILKNYSRINPTSQVLINLALRQFMTLSDVGGSLVNSACYLDDICSIFELDIPWTRPYIAHILYLRLNKGFQPRQGYWDTDGNSRNSNGLVKFMRKCLGDTTKIKGRIKQICSIGDDGKSECDELFAEHMKRTRYDVRYPLSFYELCEMGGTTYTIMGKVERGYICQSFDSNCDEENRGLKNLYLKKDKKDKSGLFIKIKNKQNGEILEKNSWKKRYFVVSDRYIYEYFEEGKNATVHKLIDMTNLNVYLTTINEEDYICLCYLETPFLLFQPKSTITTIDNYLMDEEHYSSQLYLWYFVLRCVSRMSFSPPLEEESLFLKPKENCVWRENTAIENGYENMKQFGFDHFFSWRESKEYLHNELLPLLRIKEITKSRYLRMMISLIQEYDWELMLFSSTIISIMNNDMDESSRSVLTSHGITYMTENRRKTTGVMKIQSLIECLQAKSLMSMLENYHMEIVVLQRFIRSVSIRKITKEDVEKCDKYKTYQPHSLSILSPRIDESYRENEEVFITQSMISHCLESVFGVQSTLLKYMEFYKENHYMSRLKKCLPENVFDAINYAPVYAYYYCDDNEEYAIVYVCLFKKGMH